MSRRIVILAILLVSLLGGLVPSVAAAATSLPLPSSMAAVGDSITQAASTDGQLGVDAPANSWSTGTNTTVNSHYLRLLALGAPISGQNNNLSVSGSKAADLDAQMANVVSLTPDFLTVQIGGNDLCTDTFAAMTPVDTFRSQFQTAMDTLTTGSPNTNVYVVSIPDAYQLWSLFHSDWYARFIWSVGGVCQSLLANPTSTQAVDVQRRADVQQRNKDYNTQLQQVCESSNFAAHCRWDGNAVFNLQFAKSDVAGDYFHPSIAGQAKLAAASWAVGYTWTSTPPPNVPPTASFTSSCSNLTCAFTDTSTDSDGTIASRSWNFGDSATATETTATETNPSHSYASAGTYTVNLTVTDNAGATASATSQVAVTSPPTAQSMWVDSLSAKTKAGRSSWTATVTVHVTGATGSVSGVTVAGLWSGVSGAQTCTTGSTGICTLKSSSLANSTLSVAFAVTSLTKAGWTYDATRNPLNATSITIQKP